MANWVPSTEMGIVPHIMAVRTSGNWSDQDMRARTPRTSYCGTSREKRQRTMFENLFLDLLNVVSNAPSRLSRTTPPFASASTIIAGFAREHERLTGNTDDAPDIVTRKDLV